MIEMQRNEPKKPQVCGFLAVLVALGEPGDIPGVGHHVDELLAHMGLPKVHWVILQFGVGHFHDVLDLVLLGGLGKAQPTKPVGQLVELILRHGVTTIDGLMRSFDPLIRLRIRHIERTCGWIRIGFFMTTYLRLDVNIPYGLIEIIFSGNIRTYFLRIIISAGLTNQFRRNSGIVFLGQDV